MRPHLRPPAAPGARDCARAADPAPRRGSCSAPGRSTAGSACSRPSPSPAPTTPPAARPPPRPTCSALPPHGRSRRPSDSDALADKCSRAGAAGSGPGASVSPGRLTRTRTRPACSDDDLHPPAPLPGRSQASLRLAAARARVAASLLVLLQFPEDSMPGLEVLIHRWQRHVGGGH